MISAPKSLVNEFPRVPGAASAAGAVPQRVHERVPHGAARPSDLGALPGVARCW